VAPFTDAAVGRFITSSVASLTVAQCLRTLDAAGAPACVIVAFLEGIVHDRQARSRAELVVDRSIAFISSANFTEAAQKRNIEIGALIRSASFAERLDSHFDALAASGIVVRVPGL